MWMSKCIGASILVCVVWSSASGAIDGRAVYIFDDTAGTSVPDNSSTGDNDGVLSGDPLTSTDVPFPYAGNLSLSLDGSNDKMTLDAGSLATMGADATLEMHLKASSFSGERWLTRIGRSGFGSGSGYYGIRFNGGQLQAFYGSQSTTTATLPTSALPTDEWFHLAVTFDHEGAVQIYIDGVAAGTPGDWTGQVGTNFPLTDVFAEGSSNFYQGLADELRISEGILSPAQILFDANNSLVPEPTGLAVIGLVAYGLTLRGQRRMRIRR